SLALRRWQPDLVHLHTGRATWLGGLAARRAGLPAITTRRMDRPVKRNRRNRKIYGSLTQRAVGISGAVADCLRDGGVDPSRIVVIHSSVDVESLQMEASRAEVRGTLGVSKGEVLLLVLASLVRRKGLDLLIEALAGLETEVPWRLCIGGDGPERSTLEESARALPQVQFLGQRSDKADLLGACDVFCLPSRAEGLGVAALEAMACGRAVLASRVGGLGQAVIHEETGLLVEPESVEGLRGALLRLLEDVNLRQRLGEAGPPRVREGYSAAQMTSSYEALYREVLSERAGESVR
ncbi:MAG: glycosyltransferase family 4 protein, partial [Planctomycetota bacterium]